MVLWLAQAIDPACFLHMQCLSFQLGSRNANRIKKSGTNPKFQRSSKFYFLILEIFEETMLLPDARKTGRRTGMERRHFSYTIHMPERRSLKDRRNNKDRRVCMRPVSENKK
jgi:hypothetical protein